MKIVNQKAYEDFKKVNSDNFYNRSTIKYAEEWADLMEIEIESGKSVSEIAKETSHKVPEDITGSQYNYAVRVLCDCWIYGEELRKFHNKKYGHDGEGIVDSCSITIKPLSKSNSFNKERND